MSHRLFAALMPPADVIADLERFLEPRRDHPDWRWTLPETWHITLAFMEDVDDHHLDRVVEALGELAPRPLQVQVAGGLAFPNPARARLLGLQVHSDPVDGIDQLAASVRGLCAHAGARVDGETFRAHVTLGRCNQPQQATRWLQLLDTWRSRPWVVRDLALVESHLGEGPGGRPRHETIASVPLLRVR